MNEEQFLRICKGCDEALLPEQRYFRIANPWLHPIREHPFFLKSYARILQCNSVKSVMNGFYDLTRYIAGWGVFLAKIILFYRWKLKPCFGVKYQYDVLVVSHLFDVSILNKKDDLYFGDLIDHLERSNLKALILYINHSSANVDNYPEVRHRIVLPAAQTLPAEINNLWALLRESFTLMVDSWRVAEKIKKKIMRRAAIESLSGSARMTCRIGDQVGNIVELSNPRYIITTFEGHAWERIAAARAKMINPSVIWMAYQHGNLFRLQHSLRRSLGKHFDPDVIFCSGSTPMRDLSTSLRIPNIPLYNMGSPRAIKHVSATNDRNEATRERTCLVIPDGIKSEIIYLFNFAIHCAQVREDYNFILRLHPSNSFEELSRRNRELANLPRNVIISASTLEEDAAKSAWVIYRGSSAVISATVNGSYPIYLKKNKEISIDPLYGLAGEISKVLTCSDLFEVILNKNGSPCTDENMKKLKSFCESIYTQWNPEILIKYIYDSKHAI